MYLNILITVIAAIVAFWFLYDSVLARIFHKPGKMFSAMTGHSPDFLNTYGQLQAEFQKGHFEQVVTLADAILSDRPFESSSLSYKAYALYHLKKYAEAKELFLLLNTLPNQDCTKMLEKINKLWTT